MIAGADVGDYRHIAEVKAAALPQDSSPGSLQHCGGHRRVGQHAPSARRTAAVTGVDLPAADPDPLGASGADGGPAGGGDV